MGFFCATVNAHHALDEHLTQVVEPARELHPQERRGQDVAFVSFDFLPAGGVEAARFCRKMAAGPLLSSMAATSVMALQIDRIEEKDVDRISIFVEIQVNKTLYEKRGKPRAGDSIC
jgi:hypothetical protein